MRDQTNVQNAQAALDRDGNLILGGADLIRALETKSAKAAADFGKHTHPTPNIVPAV